MRTCVYVLNQVSTKRIRSSTSYEKWNRRKPNIAHLRVFGSLNHVKNMARRLSKVDGRIVKFFCGL